jgi:signal transduction histidine kinase/PAS domain-containing protein
VEDLIRALQTGSFQEVHYRSLGGLIVEHLFFIVVVVSVSVLIFSALYVVRLNRKLISSKRKIEESSMEIRHAYDELKAESEERRRAENEIQRLYKISRTQQEELMRKHDELSVLFEKVGQGKREWEATMDCVGDMIILTDDSGHIRRCNKVFREFAGMPYNDIIGRDWKALFYEQGLQVEKVGKGNNECFHRPSGRWFVSKCYDVNDVGVEGISGAVITVSDFTEVKVATEEVEKTNTTLEKDREQLRSALDEISSLIQQVVKEKNIKVRFRNASLRKCFEVTGCEKKECPSFGAEDGRCWQTPGTLCSGHVEGVFSGTVNCEECLVFKLAMSDPIYQIGQHFNNMMHILESMNNELQEAYTELQTAQSHILQQEKMASIGQLAAGVAHEINNPIGFIMSNLGTLQKYSQKFLHFIEVQEKALAAAGGGPERIDATLGEVQEQRRLLKLDYIAGDVGSLVRESLEGAERVKRIVQDLKSFSRVDEVGYKTADINEGIESTINIVWNELKYKVNLKKEYGTIPVTKCNLGQLNQVFMNLLVNAAQAIEKQGEIVVRTWSENGSIFVSVADTGSGIPPEKISRIFEPFFTTKEAGKGTGLGLSIAYDIVKKHSGEIRVESEMGKGSAFIVRIPVIGG